MRDLIWAALVGLRMEAAHTSRQDRNGRRLPRLLPQRDGEGAAARRGSMRQGWSVRSAAIPSLWRSGITPSSIIGTTSSRRPPSYARSAVLSQPIYPTASASRYRPQDRQAAADILSSQAVRGRLRATGLPDGRHPTARLPLRSRPAPITARLPSPCTWRSASRAARTCTATRSRAALCCFWRARTRTTSGCGFWCWRKPTASTQTNQDALHGRRDRSPAKCSVIKAEADDHR